MCISSGLRGEVRAEWDETKQHDVLFLLTIRPPDAGQLAEMKSRAEPPGVMELYGLVTVRGCEVIEVKDEGEIFTRASPNACDGLLNPWADEDMGAGAMVSAQNLAVTHQSLPCLQLSLLTSRWTC